MQILNTIYAQKQPNFKAKFFDTPNLRQVVDNSLQKGTFQELKNAAFKISKTDLTTRVCFEMGYEDTKPFVKFFTFIPKTKIICPKTLDDYKCLRTCTYYGDHNENVLDLVEKNIIKLSDGAPKSKFYRKTIALYNR